MIDNISKKTRALPHVWKCFSALKNGETFFNSLSKSAFVHRKTGPFSSRRNHDNQWFFQNPFRRVKTTVLVRDAKTGGKASEYTILGTTTGRPFVPVNVQPLTPEEGVNVIPTEPNNDNGISGPTA